jgi:hypothetical protein
MEWMRVEPLSESGTTSNRVVYEELGQPFEERPRRRASEPGGQPSGDHDERRLPICFDITTATSAPNTAPARTRTSHGTP